jgi:hypothetical protein
LKTSRKPKASGFHLSGCLPSAFTTNQRKPLDGIQNYQQARSRADGFSEADRTAPRGTPISLKHAIMRKPPLPDDVVQIGPAMAALPNNKWRLFVYYLSPVSRDTAP